MTAATAGVPRSSPAVRAWLDAAETERLDRELAAGLDLARAQLDLTPAEHVLEQWWQIATIRANPLTDAERAQLARARTGDLTGFWVLESGGGRRQL